VLPAKGCGARKCINTSGPLDGLNIHQHLGGQVKQIYTPDLYIRLRHGGAFELSVCREDKIEFLRSVVQSLALHPSANRAAKQLISEIEKDPQFSGVWGNIKRLVKAPSCKVCTMETNFGGKGEFSLCGEHNTWRMYFRLKRGN
jgi:hypothetical protein